MRFEIGPGGGFVILLGLLGLSAAVFFLGMISGRESAQSALNQDQLATTYPLPPAAPEAAPAPANQTAAVAPAAAVPAAAQPTQAQAAGAVAPSATAPAARAAVASAAPPPAAMPKPQAEKPAAAEHPAPPRPALASAPPPRPAAPAQAETAAAAVSAAAERAGARAREERAGASAAESHPRGYNIVIDAAMDRSGADKMASRLLALGYTPHIIPTLINGGTWYKVEVGPYPSQEDASGAQSQLRA